MTYDQSGLISGLPIEKYDPVVMLVLVKSNTMSVSPSHDVVLGNGLGVTSLFHPFCVPIIGIYDGDGGVTTTQDYPVMDDLMEYYKAERSAIIDNFRGTVHGLDDQEYYLAFEHYNIFKDMVRAGKDHSSIYSNTDPAIRRAMLDKEIDEYITWYNANNTDMSGDITANTIYNIKLKNPNIGTSEHIMELVYFMDSMSIMNRMLFPTMASTDNNIYDVRFVFDSINTKAKDLRHRYQHSELKKDSNTWCKILGVLVLDPDGWDRTNYEESWGEYITYQEFQKRLYNSTTLLKG